MAAVDHRVIYIDLCPSPPVPSGVLEGAPGGALITQGIGDTKVYHIYFKDGNRIVDPPAGVDFVFAAKHLGDWGGDPLILQNSADGGSIKKLNDDQGDGYLKLTLAPTQELVDLLKPSKSSCPSPSPADQIRTIQLMSQLSWTDGNSWCRAKQIPLWYERGVMTNDEAIVENDPLLTPLTIVAIEPGNDLIAGAGTVLDPLRVLPPWEKVELPIDGLDVVNMADPGFAAIYGALDFVPAGYQASAVIPPDIDADPGIAITAVKGNSIRLQAPAPAGYKLSVLALRG